MTSICSTCILTAHQAVNSGQSGVLGKADQLDTGSWRVTVLLRASGNVLESFLLTFSSFSERTSTPSLLFNRNYLYLICSYLSVCGFHYFAASFKLWGGGGGVGKETSPLQDSHGRTRVERVVPRNDRSDS